MRAEEMLPVVCVPAWMSFAASTPSQPMKEIKVAMIIIGGVAERDLNRTSVNELSYAH